MGYMCRYHGAKCPLSPTQSHLKEWQQDPFFGWIGAPGQKGQPKEYTLARAHKDFKDLRRTQDRKLEGRRPDAKRLYVLVVRCRDLAEADVMGKSDPYVALELGDQRAETRVIDQELNPVWNQELALELTSFQDSLRVKVFDKATGETSARGVDSPSGDGWTRRMDPSGWRIGEGQGTRGQYPTRKGLIVIIRMECTPTM